MLVMLRVGAGEERLRSAAHARHAGPRGASPALTHARVVQPRQNKHVRVGVSLHVVHGTVALRVGGKAGTGMAARRGGSREAGGHTTGCISKPLPPILRPLKPNSLPSYLHVLVELLLCRVAPLLQPQGAEAARQRRCGERPAAHRATPSAPPVAAPARHLHSAAQRTSHSTTVSGMVSSSIVVRQSTNGTPAAQHRQRRRDPGQALFRGRRAGGACRDARPCAVPHPPPFRQPPKPLTQDGSMEEVRPHVDHRTHGQPARCAAGGMAGAGARTVTWGFHAAVQQCAQQPPAFSPPCPAAPPLPAPMPRTRPPLNAQAGGRGELVRHQVLRAGYEVCEGVALLRGAWVGWEAWEKGSAGGGAPAAGAPRPPAFTATLQPSAQRNTASQTHLKVLSMLIPPAPQLAAAAHVRDGKGHAAVQQGEAGGAEVGVCGVGGQVWACERHLCNRPPRVCHMPCTPFPTLPARPHRCRSRSCACV